MLCLSLAEYRVFFYQYDDMRCFYVNTLINWCEWRYLARATDLFRIAEGVLGVPLRHLLALKVKLKIYGRKI